VRAGQFQAKLGAAEPERLEQPDPEQSAWLREDTSRTDDP
jgi:hypothetical protein